MKKTVAILLSLTLLLASVFTVSAATVSMEYEGVDLDTPLEENLQANAQVGESLQISAKSAILMEYNTGKILYEMNTDQRLAPASITKIMSLILVMEAIETGKLSLTDKITASEHAASMGGSQIWLEPGEVMTVDELLRATVIASANDATVALAEAVAGSEEGFVAMMNKRAKELGMNGTTFVNSYGLDAEGHLTTAYDVAVMSRELIRHELILKYSTVKTDSLRNGESELVNTNKLIRYYEGAFGLKTGTTSGAGSCLSAAAERNGLTLIAVVLGSPSSKERFAGTQKLLDFGFANFCYEKIEFDTSKLVPIEVQRGVERTVIPVVKEGFSALLKKGQEDSVSSVVEISESLTAPIKAGDTVGYVRFFANGQEIGVLPITAQNGSEELTYRVCLARLFRSIFTL